MDFAWPLQRPGGESESRQTRLVRCLADPGYGDRIAISACSRYEGRLEWGGSFARRCLKRIAGDTFAGGRIRKAHVFRAIRARPRAGEILDAGCGYGDYCFFLAGFPGASVVGVDSDERALAVCEDRRRQHGVTNVEFRRWNLQESVGSGQYRLIVCVDVLDDIPDDVAALGRFFRATAEGGELVLHVPLKGKPVLFNAISRFPYQLSVRQYSTPEIEEKVRRAGFSIVEKRMTFGFFGAIARELWYVAWRAHPSRFLKVAIHPAVMLLGWFDVLLPVRNGRGCLLVCRR